MFRSILFVFILSLFAITSGYASSKRSADTLQFAQPGHDLVFCLDLSGSTNGLINDLRDNLWAIANVVNQRYPNAGLRIGVVGFSRPSFGKATGYVKVLADLTPNLDYVAQELYRLKPSIEKGDQIVSAALSTAVDRMNWSTHPQSQKTIFIIGNGMVSANGYEYVKSCEKALERKIVINTIYIPNGGRIMNELPGWRRIATITYGLQGEMKVNATDDLHAWPDPYERILEVNNRLNSTYLWAGADSAFCAKMQFSADSGAFFNNNHQVFFHRSYYKTTSAYADLFNDCDMTAHYLSKTATDGQQGQDDFFRQMQKQAQEQMNFRKHYAFAIQEALQTDGLIKYTKAIELNTHEHQNGVLHRVVLAMLLKQWKP